MVLNVDSVTIASVYGVLCLDRACAGAQRLTWLISPLWPYREEVLSFRVDAAQGYTTVCRESWGSCCGWVLSSSPETKSQPLRTAASSAGLP